MMSKLLFKRQGGTLGQQENSNETKTEKICPAETIRIQHSHTEKDMTTLSSLISSDFK